MTSESVTRTSRTVGAVLGTLAVAMAGAVAPVVATASEVTDPASLQPVDTPSRYPGAPPGAAEIDESGTDLTLHNDAISVTWSFGGDTARLSALEHVATGHAAAIDASSLLTLHLADGTKISDGAMTRIDGPTVRELTPSADAARWAERDGGVEITATFRYDDGSGNGVDLTWAASLRDGSATVGQRFTLSDVRGSFDVTSVDLVDADWPGARVEGEDDGSPVVIGEPGHETFFVGVENPMSRPVVESGKLRIDVPRSAPLVPDTEISYTTSIGTVPQGQLRRAFRHYVERERVHARRTFLHYQSWLDLKPPSEVIDANELNEAITLFGSELTSRGATIDSFWVDDGWDYVRSPAVEDESDLAVWDFDPTEFPDGFAPQKEIASTFDASMSVWMSPYGGYGLSSVNRRALNASKPADERLETNDSGYFALGGERYSQRFREVIFDMVDNQGVRGFKFDGIGGGIRQSGPNPEYLGDYEALLDLMTDLREHESEVWINATVGTWGSPYWLWYADSIWRDGSDYGQSGQGSPRQQSVNYRDSETYRNIVDENPLFPVPSLMNHGLTFTDLSGVPMSTDLSDPLVRDEVAEDMRAYFALGLGLQELYVRNTMVRPDQPGAEWFWDELAKNARWARDHENLLADTHWVGGDAAYGGVYGTAAWAPGSTGSTPDQGMLMLRNSAGYPQEFAIDVVEVFDPPAGAADTYAFSDRDGVHDGFVAGAGAEYRLELDPYEVVILEAVASDEEPTPSEPSRSPLDKTGWSATADSEETVLENGAAARAIDGERGTIWHSRYSDGIAPLPHELTIDLGGEYEIDGLRHLSRQDGGTNGRISTYEIATSLDGASWTTVGSGEFNGTAAPDHVELEPGTARYVRLLATGSANGLQYTSVAEIDIFGRPAEVPVDVTARSACLGGTAAVAVRAKNTSDGALDMRLVTPYGTRDVEDVAPGAWAYQAFTTREAQIDAGEVEVDVEGMGVVSATYDAASC
ncbi:discoidin domain-containing protein [Isoptericola sp. b515]|uniref:discoidin domain-containing protein n=1 Tax=Isoptericola sp. b515 TaxID=3064652 RepID=UPI002713CC58|nr:discoidin domain-containing protein [Isoptericola sp. b515]MDO8149165.1 discoidin domain-containing protein [Isoptericola sp. b515]